MLLIAHATEILDDFLLVDPTDHRESLGNKIMPSKLDSLGKIRTANMLCDDLHICNGVHEELTSPDNTLIVLLGGRIGRRLGAVVPEHAVNFRVNPGTS